MKCVIYLIAFFRVWVGLFVRGLGCNPGTEHCAEAGRGGGKDQVGLSYLYFMPVRMLWSLDEGMFCTERCPRLRATRATARNLLFVLGLLAFCRLSRSSVLRFEFRWSVQTKDTCMAEYVAPGTPKNNNNAQ